MKQVFINTLVELAKKDKRIFLLTGDLGFSALEKFREKFPKRFFNMGVAEANMIGVAAGLSLSGKIVFVYSIASFITLRCLEQIRNDICYQNLNVKLIGIGGGLCYGQAGATHHSIEDIALMRVLPNMTTICPGDPLEAEMAIKLAVFHQGPIYIRLGKSGEAKVHLKTPRFKIGKGITIREGNDITIIATGNMLYNAKQVADRLLNNNFSISLISMPTIKPIDKEIILKAAKETKAIFTIEEHSLIGGLGGAVAEVLAESGEKILFKRIALPDSFSKDIGSQEYLREKNGLSIERITNAILEMYKKLKNENNGKRKTT